MKEDLTNKGVNEAEKIVENEVANTEGVTPIVSHSTILPIEGVTTIVSHSTIFPIEGEVEITTDSNSKNIGNMEKILLIGGPVIVILVLVGLMFLMFLGENFTKEKYESSIPITVDSAWSISTTEKDTEVVEYTDMYSYGCSLEDNSLFVTVENHNTTYQLLCIGAKDYLIKPMSKQTVEIPIPDNLKYDVKYTDGSLEGKVKFTDLTIDRVILIPKDEIGDVTIPSSSELFVSPEDTTNRLYFRVIDRSSIISGYVEDSLYLSCDFDIDENNSINPKNIVLSTYNEAVSQNVGECSFNYRAKVTHDGHRVISIEDEDFDCETEKVEGVEQK